MDSTRLRRNSLCMVARSLGPLAAHAAAECFKTRAWYYFVPCRGNCRRLHPCLSWALLRVCCFGLTHLDAQRQPANMSASLGYEAAYVVSLPVPSPRPVFAWSRWEVAVAGCTDSCHELCALWDAVRVFRACDARALFVGALVQNIVTTWEVVRHTMRMVVAGSCTMACDCFLYTQ